MSAKLEGKVAELDNNMSIARNAAEKHARDLDTCRRTERSCECVCADAPVCEDHPPCAECVCVDPEEQPDCAKEEMNLIAVAVVGGLLVGIALGAISRRL
ncbi:MAG: hypothetical protein ACPG77_10540 [Nannocystaceae bacterium]